MASLKLTCLPLQYIHSPQQADHDAPTSSDVTGDSAIFRVVAGNWSAFSPSADDPGRCLHQTFDCRFLACWIDITGRYAPLYDRRTGGSNFLRQALIALFYLLNQRGTARKDRRVMSGTRERPRQKMSSHGPCVARHSDESIAVFISAW